MYPRIPNNFCWWYNFYLTGISHTLALLRGENRLKNWIKFKIENLAMINAYMCVPRLLVPVLEAEFTSVLLFSCFMSLIGFWYVLILALQKTLKGCELVFFFKHSLLLFFFFQCHLSKVQMRKQFNLLTRSNKHKLNQMELTVSTLVFAILSRFSWVKCYWVIGLFRLTPSTRNHCRPDIDFLISSCSFPKICPIKFVFIDSKRNLTFPLNKNGRISINLSVFIL